MSIKSVTVLKNFMTEPHLGDCPICFLPMPIDPKKIFWPCCSEVFCMGCVHANIKSNKHDFGKALRCPFCRDPGDDDENDKKMMKRVKANDPVALRETGTKGFHEGDYDTAFKYLSRAAELGDVDAHAKLGMMYEMGRGVEEDVEKAVYHDEKAAIGGHPQARYNLAYIEEANGNMERAVKHFIIAAKLGHLDVMRDLWKHYSAGNITKEDLDATLRSH